MRILIVGAGAVGYHLAERLSEEGEDVVVIDKDPERTEVVSDHLDVLPVTGNGASFPVLQEAGVSQADLLLAVTSQDEVNLVACPAAAATLGNIGPGLGDVGAVDNYGWMGPTAQLLLTFLMVVGRLELFTVLLLFHPDLWRGRRVRSAG